jgi:RNA polymerase sigma-70 factor (ECF subfamily)
VLSKNKDKEAIHDSQFHEVENGKIVALKSYFFRKEFLLAASCELGLNVQLVKPPVDWS